MEFASMAERRRVTNEVQRLRAQRDELLAACQAAAFAIQLGEKSELAPYWKAWGGLFDSLHAAIAKATK